MHGVPLYDVRGAMPPLDPPMVVEATTIEETRARVAEAVSWGNYERAYCGAIAYGDFAFSMKQWILAWSLKPSAFLRPLLTSTA